MRFFKIYNCLFLLFLLYSIVCVQKVVAQEFIDLLSIGNNYVPENKYQDSDSSFKFSHNFLNVQYPKVFKNGDIFLSKLSLNQYRIIEDTNSDFYIFYFQLGMLKKLGEKSSLRFAIFPKIASQLTDIDKNDFLMPCIAMVQFKHTEKLTYGFGLLYSYEFFGHYLNPAIYVKWKIADRWTFYADFPSYGYVMYQATNIFNTGIYVSSSTTSIRLSEKYNSQYLQKSYADFSLFLDVNFTKNIVLRAKGGYSIMRALDVYAKKETVPFAFSVIEFNDNRTQLSRDIDDALFFEISLNYRYNY